MFNEMEDFYCSLMKDEETSSLFSDFMRAYEGSLGGCKCTSGSRRRYAENLYVNIDETFTQEKLDILLRVFTATMLVFVHKGEKLMSIK